MAFINLKKKKQGMEDITYYSDDYFPGEGISIGIARGILVKYKDKSIVQEGLGIGSLALKNKQTAYFPSSCETMQLSETQFRKTFLVDSVMLWKINGKLSKFLTKVIDNLAEYYMLLPPFQNKLLKTGTFFRNLFKLAPQIIKIDPIAEANFNYFIENGELHVDCMINSLSGYLSKVYILNELGADFFQKGSNKGEIIPGPTGWEYISTGSDFTSLYSPDCNITFNVKKIKTKNEIPYKIFWGREKTKDCCWAGFEFEFDCSNKKLKSLSCEYDTKIN
jgi:hypothetical protein